MYVPNYTFFFEIDIHFFIIVRNVTQAEVLSLFLVVNITNSLMIISKFIGRLINTPGVNNTHINTHIIQEVNTKIHNNMRTNYSADPHGPTRPPNKFVQQ